MSATRSKPAHAKGAERCIFCRIVAGEAPAWVVYEDEHAIAFLDTRPIAPGHILVCPKAHSERLTHMEEMANLTHALQKVAKMVEESLATDYNIGANQGALAGQVVFHHHWHVIPRYEGERRDFWTRMELTDTMAKEILTKLGAAPEKRGVSKVD